MAKQIPLTQGKFAIVDDHVYEWASKHEWRAIWNGYNWYACRSGGRWPNRKMIYLHREIMKAPPGVQVDHWDRDTLNDLDNNLRLATHAENVRNRGAPASNTSGYKGVSWNRGAGKWGARIGVDGEYIHLGYFDDPTDAARARDAAAREHHGDFAFQNFPEEGQS